MRAFLMKVLCKSTRPRLLDFSIVVLSVIVRADARLCAHLPSVNIYVVICIYIRSVRHAVEESQRRTTTSCAIALVKHKARQFGALHAVDE